MLQGGRGAESVNFLDRADERLDIIQSFKAQGEKELTEMWKTTTRKYIDNGKI